MYINGLVISKTIREMPIILATIFWFFVFIKLAKRHIAAIIAAVKIKDNVCCSPKISNGAGIESSYGAGIFPPKISSFNDTTSVDRYKI